MKNVSNSEKIPREPNQGTYTRAQASKDQVLKGKKLIGPAIESSETRHALFSWELAANRLRFEPPVPLQRKIVVHKYIGYFLLSSVILGLILAAIITLLPHQISGFKQAVFGLKIEVYYSATILITILSCLIIFAVKNAFDKNKFAWVVVGSGFSLLIGIIAGYVFNLHAFGSMYLNFLLVFLIILIIILGTIALILTLTSRYIFESELTL